MRSAYILIFAILAAAVSAVSVEYTASISYIGQSNSTEKISLLITQDCSSKDICLFPLPQFSLPENSTATGYEVLSSSGDYRAYFHSTKERSSSTADMIAVELIAKAPQCTNSACDPSCVRCEDGNCHLPGFLCVAELTLDKVVPESIKTGVSQLNILLRNTGTVDVRNIVAEVSGDGISTVSRIPLPKLIVADKDYAFVTINATKAGAIDVILRITIDNRTTTRIPSSIIVTADAVPVSQPKDEFNRTEIRERLDSLKQKYSVLEKEYQSKKGGFVLDGAELRLREAYTFVSSAEVAFFEENFKKSNTNLDIAQERLAELEREIGNAEVRQRKFIDKVRENLTYIASFTAAIISIITAVTLINKYVNKERIMKLKDTVHLPAKKEKGKKGKRK